MSPTKFSPDLCPFSLGSGLWGREVVDCAIEDVNMLRDGIESTVLKWRWKLVSFLINFIHYITINRLFSYLIKNYRVSWRSCNEFGSFCHRRPAIKILVIVSLVNEINPIKTYKIAISKSS